MRHLIGKTGLLDGSHGVTTTDDSDAALGSKTSQALGDAVGSYNRELEIKILYE